jgi:hypothetical protein
LDASPGALKPHFLQTSATQKGSLKGKPQGSKLEWMITASDSSRFILPYYPEMFNESAIKFYSCTPVLARFHFG